VSDFLIGRLGLPTAGENEFSKTNQRFSASVASPSVGETVKTCGEENQRECSSPCSAGNRKVRHKEAHEFSPRPLALHRKEHVVDMGGADGAFRYLFPRRVRVRVRLLKCTTIIEVQSCVELTDHPRHGVLLPNTPRLYQAIDIALHVGDEPPAAPWQAAVTPLGCALELGRHLGKLQI